jgi:hypothetical protein
MHMQMQGWNERMEKVKSPGATEDKRLAGWTVTQITLGIRLTETDRFGSSVLYEIRLA